MSPSNESARVEGKVEEIGGTLKKSVGQIIGNEQMELEGKLHEVRGQAHQESAKAGERQGNRILTGQEVSMC